MQHYRKTSHSVYDLKYHLMDKNRCHIGKFNLQECRLVIQACEKLYEANPRLKLFKEYCDSL